jgi:mannan endo-1,4-beta-mannosidase
MNGDFFWWSTGTDNGWATREEFRGLWSHMFKYLCGERQLDNLLWVYSPNAQTSPGLKSTTYYYPGEHQVDVVALDHYGNTLDGVNAEGGYDALLELGKPIGLAEVGPAFWGDSHPSGQWDNTLVINSIRASYPQMSFFTHWHGWGTGAERIRMAIIENRNAARLLDDPWVITRGEVNWRGAAGNFANER